MPQGVGYGPYAAPGSEEQPAMAPKMPMPPMPEGMEGMMGAEGGLPPPPGGEDAALQQYLAGLSDREKAALVVEIMMSRGGKPGA
jgi:hypothetical protein